MSGHKRALAGLLWSVLLLTGVPASAEDPEAPPVVLRIGERAQNGLLVSSSRWTGPIPPPEGAPPGQYCGFLHSDGWGFPSPRRVPRGELSARIEFQKAEAPEELAIRGWTAIEDGQPRGRRAFGYSLRSVEEGGRVVAWVADVSLRVRKHLYLDVGAEWSVPEEPGECPEGLQEGVWHFHVKTNRA